MFGQPNEAQLMKEEQRKAENFQREQTNIANAATSEQLDMMQTEQRTDFLKWQQESDPEIRRLILILLGYVEETPGRWTQHIRLKQCNEKFISHVVEPNMKTFLSPNLFNSNMKENEKLQMLKFTSNRICDLMVDNYDQYDINPLNMDNVLGLIKNTMRIACNRAVSGWTKKMDSTVIRKVDTTSEVIDDKNQKKGWGFW